MKTNIALTGIKTQELIAKTLDLYWLEAAGLLRNVDAELWGLYTKMKALGADRQMSGESWGYIWRSQDDSRVRASHAQNDDQEFSWDQLPASGHPGEDFNCRCWAEPLGDSYYASQLLITEMKDNPKKWKTKNFIEHYRSGKGEEITLQQAGYLGDVIEHFGYTLEKYESVNSQIIEAAMQIGEGRVPYDFSNVYDFGGWLSTFFPFIFDGVTLSLGDSTIEGVFDGEVRKEKGHLIINGIMSYEFIDAFTDPTSKVDALMEEEGITRQEAINRLGDDADEYGVPYDIKDTWQTKFNATVRIEK